LFCCFNFCFFFQAVDGIRVFHVTGVQTCALPILTSILIQGTTLSVVAKWLRVSIPSEEKKISPSEKFLEEHPKTEMREIGIAKGDRKSVVEGKIVDRMGSRYLIPV